MKIILTKIASLTLALLVLFSTFSFTVEKHFCGDFLVEVSFTGETKGCGMKMDKVSQTKKKNCCKDETLKVEGQDELQINNLDRVSFEKQQFLTAFVFSCQNLFFEKSTLKVDQCIFPPPEIYQNYQITYQSFLI